MDSANPLALPGALAPAAPALARALLLAAGRGERMRPLTDTCPKPLLPVRGKPLMQWHLEALQRSGMAPVLINTAWLGEQMEARFGPALATPGQPPLPLLYSHEGQDFGGALETAGGIARALPRLAEVFWVLAGDVFVPGFEFAAAALQAFEASDALAHIWLVPNPQHNPAGDFGLDAHGQARDLPKDTQAPRWTYSTIGLYRRALFLPPWCDIAPGNPQGQRAALAPLLRKAMAQGRVTASLYTGAWTDVGTPERLQQLNASHA